MAGKPASNDVSDLKMSMSNPNIVMCGARSVRIDFPRLFQAIESRPYKEFLMRGFALDDVVAVEIDRTRGSALVHLHPGSSSIPDAMLNLADKLEGLPSKALMPLRGTYFLLQEIDGRYAYARAPRGVSGARRFLYAGLGTLFFGLGIVGVVAPLVPTAPFVILSSYFALRSSPRLNRRLLQSRLFGRIVLDWHLYRAMRRSTMNRVLIFTIILIALTFALARPSGSAQTIALVISGLSFWFILRMPVVEDEESLPARVPGDPPRIAIAP